MAYVSDVSTTKSEAEAALGSIMMLYMLGCSGGGICAILMEEQGLFMPLFLGSAMSFAAALLAQFFLIEPSRPTAIAPANHDDVDIQQDDAEETKHEDDQATLAAPKEINKMQLFNIALGSLADNIGSSGLFPLCLTPLMFDTFYLDMIAAGEDPIMSVNAYKWIFVMAALLVIPGVAISVPVFNKMGVAASCILGNLITGVVSASVLCIGLAEASELTFGFFVAAVYIGFPFTVLSQLTTAPMLDAVTPLRHRGLVQGLNISVMAFGTAVSPFMLGAVADSQGTKTCIFICVGISGLAAAINLPLLWAPALQRATSVSPGSSFPGEDAEIVKRAEEGKYVPFADLDKINDARMRKGLPILHPDIPTYADDEHRLEELRSYALKDFKSVTISIAENLNELGDSCEKRVEMCEMYLKTREENVEHNEKKKTQMGEWFTDYLDANGYWMGDHPTLLKQMIMSAFPPLIKGGIPTPQNIEETMVKCAHVFTNHIGNEENEDSIFKRLGSSTPRDLSHLSEH